MTQVICTAFRPTTNSILMVEIPHNVWTKDRETLNDPSKCDYHSTQWIGEEFSWNFVPMALVVEN